jgi:hypothetical protein
MADNKTIPADKYGVTLLAVTIAEDYLQSGTMPAPVTDEVLEREQAADLPLTVLTTDKAMEKEGTQVMHGRTLALDDAPELDPSNPQYNPQAYSKRLQELAADITETKATLYAGAATAAGAALRHIMGGLDSLMPKAETIINALPEIVKSVQDALKNLAGIDWELLPYISKELEKPENKELVEKCGTIKDLTKAPEWQAILKAARQAQVKEKATTLPSVLNKKLIQADYPLEYFSNSLFDEAKKLPEGQYTFITSNDTGASMCVSFSELESIEGLSFSRDLNNYDKRVWVLTSNLINLALKNGLDNAAITPATLLKLMGRGKGSNPKPSDIEKIEKSILKLSKTQVIIHNADETAHTNYSIFPDAMFYLLPVEIGDAIYSGKVIHKAILLPQTEPRLMQYARMKKQITTFNVGVLQAPLSLTDSNLALTDYLITQISHIRNGYRNRKMLFTSIFEAAGKAKTKDPGRVKEAIFSALNHYASEQAGHFIWGYEILKDGVKIYVTKEERAAAEKKGATIMPPLAP